MGENLEKMSDNFSFDLIFNLNLLEGKVGMKI